MSTYANRITGTILLICMGLFAGFLTSKAYGLDCDDYCRTRQYFYIISGNYFIKYNLPDCLDCATNGLCVSSGTIGVICKIKTPSGNAVTLYQNGALYCQPMTGTTQVESTNPTTYISGPTAVDLFECEPGID